VDVLCNLKCGARVLTYENIKLRWPSDRSFPFREFNRGDGYATSWKVEDGGHEFYMWRRKARGCKRKRKRTRHTEGKPNEERGAESAAVGDNDHDDDRSSSNFEQEKDEDEEEEGDEEEEEGEGEDGNEGEGEKLLSLRRKDNLADRRHRNSTDVTEATITTRSISKKKLRATRHQPRNHAHAPRRVGVGDKTMGRWQQE